MLVRTHQTQTGNLDDVKNSAYFFFQGLHNTSCLNASSLKSFYINHVWLRSPTIKRGTPRRDSNQGNQMWPIHVAFATDQHHISGEVLRFKFPGFVWICGGENIASLWVQSLELNLHANDGWENVAKWKCVHCHDYLMET